VFLQQNVHLVTGSIRFTYKSPSAQDFDIDYNVHGEYWEGYLNLICRSKNRKSYAHASAFLKPINNGAGLEGQFCFRHAVNDKVDSFPLILIRSN